MEDRDLDLDLDDRNSTSSRNVKMSIKVCTLWSSSEYAMSICFICLTGQECLRVDDASRQEVEANSGSSASEPCRYLCALVSKGEQVRRRQRCKNGVGVLL